MGTTTGESYEGHCPNCSAPLKGQYCYQCGQNQRGMDRVFWSLLSEALDNIFSVDSRTAKTLFAVLCRPGFITKEYLAGRRARYLPPLRLYLFASLLFFLLLSIQNTFSGQTNSEQANSGQANSGQTSITFGTAASESELLQQNQTRAAANAELSKLTTRVTLPWLTDEQNQKLTERLEIQVAKAIAAAKEDPRELAGKLLDTIPPSLFILLPIFALMLKLAYLGTGRYYTQHLIMAVHNHSFIFLILSLKSLLIPLEHFLVIDLLASLLLAWIPLYLYLSLSSVYGQGYFRTALKFVVLSALYLLFFSFTTVLSLLAGVMTL